MASENKKRKERNCQSYRGMALKQKSVKLKRALFYNAAQRKELKRLLKRISLSE